jgi:hypothetical protein
MMAFPSRLAAERQRVEEEMRHLFARWHRLEDHQLPAEVQDTLASKRAALLNAAVEAGLLNDCDAAREAP